MGIDCAVLIILHLIRILIILYSIEMLDLRIMTILYLMEMLDLRMILETHQWTVEGSINVIHIHERVETLEKCAFSKNLETEQIKFSAVQQNTCETRPHEPWSSEP